MADKGNNLLDVNKLYTNQKAVMSSIIDMREQHLNQINN